MNSVFRRAAAPVARRAAYADARRPPSRSAAAALSELFSLVVQPEPARVAAPGLSSASAALAPSPWRFFGSGRGYAAAAVLEEAVDAETGDGLEIAALGVSQQIISCLTARGITRLFPIQKAVLEPAMKGQDMIARAKTGTGKTLAFGIPIMDKIIRFSEKHGYGRLPLALVLAPTRELARQVEKEFRESSKLATLCVYGGTPISHQMRDLNNGIDVLVGTPGRVIDLLKRGALNLQEVQFVVLDEADQMLSVGFAEDVEVILGKLPPTRQSLLFSATMPPFVRNLTHKYLKNPVIIDLVGENDQKLADGISLYTIASDKYAKAGILPPLIQEHAKGGKCIVFTQTKIDADRLSYALGRNLACKALHGDISQAQREHTLAGFRDGTFNVLIATDVAARGLDIPNVDLVVHYELPNTSETFVHRSGRTGRAGKSGTAILIYSHDQTRLVRGIEQDIGCRFTELPAIEGVVVDMPVGGRSMGNYSSGGGYGRPNYGRSGGPSSAYGSPSNRSGYGDSRYNRYSGTFGSGSADGSGGFGGLNGFGDPNSNRSVGGFGSGTSGGFSNFRRGFCSSLPGYNTAVILNNFTSSSNSDCGHTPGCHCAMEASDALNKPATA